MITNHIALVGSYSLGLVALSVVIAMCASYASLDLAGRVKAARGRVQLLWTMGGATEMGLGIWSMHFIGMLAFRLPIPVFYNWPTVVLSLLAAILASAVAFYVVSRERMGAWRAGVGSILMGGGIAFQRVSPLRKLPSSPRIKPRLFRKQARVWDRHHRP
jgi:NO-binding membrane sensor protein with MHYT domain